MLKKNTKNLFFIKKTKIKTNRTKIINKLIFLTQMQTIHNINK